MRSRASIRRGEREMDEAMAGAEAEAADSNVMYFWASVHPPTHTDAQYISISFLSIPSYLPIYVSIYISIYITIYLSIYAILPTTSPSITKVST